MTTHTRPTAPPELHKSQQRTFETVFHHPTAHNLEWHDVRALLGAVGTLTEGTNGAVHVARNGHTATFHAPKHKDVAATDDVLAVRRFLEQSAAPAAAAAPAGRDLLVVIDHHGAKVYRAEPHGAAPDVLVPHDPHGYGQHLRTRGEETDGKRRPEQKEFYEAVAATLRGAARVLLFGGGTGESSAMDELLADLKRNHRDVADRVVGTVVVDAHHQTEGQLLARAREYFTGARA